MQKKKNRVIIALAVIIGFMAVGYALLSQDLTINGTANIDARWQVEITGISADFMNGASNSHDEFDEEILPTYNATTATFNVDLPHPGAQGAYEITVTNNGTIPAELTGVPDLSTTNGEDPQQIQFTVVEPDTMVLQPTESTTITVLAYWDQENDTVPESPVSKTATITLNYVQAASSDMN